ncbi:hypothetical protein V2G26_019846 [Clonostachys chloroleuca]
MSHILKLPVEILNCILGMLVTSIGPSHIHKMLLMCRCLYQLALPFSVHVFRNTPPLSVGTGDCSERRNAQFLRYILIDKSQLAHLVRVIVMGNTRSRKGGRELNADAITASTPQELDTYEQRIRDVMLPASQYTELMMRRNQLIEDLRRGFSEAQLSLILLFCRQVRTLCFEQEDPVFNLPMVMEFGAYLNTLPYRDLHPGPLSSIEEVYGEPGSMRNGKTLWQWAKMLLTLPRLRVYEAMLGDCPSAGAPVRGVPPRSAPVREIILRQSNIRAEMLNRVFQSCRAVEKFELSKYTHKNMCGSICICFRVKPGHRGALSSFVSARQVLNAILPHRDTLTHLRLILHDEQGKSMRSHPAWLVHMGTRLRNMAALQTLEIEMESLTAHHKTPVPDDCPRLVDCLPRSLVNLHIENCNALSVEPAAELLREVERGDTFTQLRQIRLLFDLDSVTVKDIDLVLISPDTTLSVMFQSRNGQFFDLAAPVNTRTRKTTSVSSRVYADDIRKKWLPLRGIAAQRDPTSWDPNKLISAPKLCSRYRDEEVEYLM